MPLSQACDLQTQDIYEFRGAIPYKKSPGPTPQCTTILWDGLSFIGNIAAGNEALLQKKDLWHGQCTAGEVNVRRRIGHTLLATTTALGWMGLRECGRPLGPLGYVRHENKLNDNIRSGLSTLNGFSLNTMVASMAPSTSCHGR